MLTSHPEQQKVFLKLECFHCGAGHRFAFTGSSSHSDHVNWREGGDSPYRTILLFADRRVTGTVPVLSRAQKVYLLFY